MAVLAYTSPQKEFFFWLDWEYRKMGDPNQLLFTLDIKSINGSSIMSVTMPEDIYYDLCAMLLCFPDEDNNEMGCMYNSFSSPYTQNGCYTFMMSYNNRYYELDEQDRMFDRLHCCGEERVIDFTIFHENIVGPAIVILKFPLSFPEAEELMYCLDIFEQYL